jgi:hypothetical protein
MENKQFEVDVHWNLDFISTSDPIYKKGIHEEPVLSLISRKIHEMVFKTFLQIIVLTLISTQFVLGQEIPVIPKPQSVILTNEGFDIRKNAPLGIAFRSSPDETSVSQKSFGPNIKDNLCSCI